MSQRFIHLRVMKNLMILPVECRGIEASHLLKKHCHSLLSKMSKYRGLVNGLIPAESVSTIVRWLHLRWGSVEVGSMEGRHWMLVMTYGRLTYLVVNPTNPPS